MTAPYDLDRERLEAICELSFLRGSGPGGQHRNKVETAVRLVHPPSGVVVVSAEHRSQLKNREAAFERLIAKLKELNHVPKTRKATKPTRGSKRRRLDAKKRRSETKKGRQQRYD